MKSALRKGLCLLLGANLLFACTGAPEHTPTPPTPKEKEQPTPTPPEKEKEPEAPTPTPPAPPKENEKEPEQPAPTPPEKEKEKEPEQPAPTPPEKEKEKEPEVPAPTPPEKEKEKEPEAPAPTPPAPPKEEEKEPEQPAPVPTPPCEKSTNILGKWRVAKTSEDYAKGSWKQVDKAQQYIYVFEKNGTFSFSITVNGAPFGNISGTYAFDTKTLTITPKGQGGALSGLYEVMTCSADGNEYTLKGKADGKGYVLVRVP